MADRAAWVQDRPVLFLGKWCCPISRQDQWRATDVEFVPYHWDDRGKYCADYQYLESVYEQILECCRSALNAFHGSSFSLRYWRILIGPWLYQFLHMLYDRWSMIRVATRLYDIEDTYIVQYPEARMIPADLRSLDPDSVAWNHYICGEIIKYLGTIRWHPVAPVSEAMLQDAPTLGRGTTGWAKVAGRNISRLLEKFTREDEALLIATYLPRWAEARLQLSLGQIPKAWAVPQFPKVAPSSVCRAKFIVSDVTRDEFVKCACSILSRQIPTVFLEGYGQLTEAADNLPWPKKPKVIFTSNLYQFNEMFQAWAAAKTEQGRPLVIGQHGGFFGVGKWVAGEEHQVKISDRFLTWGWKDERPQTYPAVALTNIGKSQPVFDLRGALLMVSVPIRLMSFKSSSWPIGANQSEEFINGQLQLARHLDERIRRHVIFRIHAKLDQKMGSFYSDRWRADFPEVKIDDSTSPIEERIRDSRLFVYTYNSTGFLESLGRNIPTIVFWSQRHFELRESAQPYFKKLKDVGIFHDTPQSAAAHIQAIWDDVAQWWQQPKVQEARRQFCEQYACMPSNPLKVLKQALLSARSHTEHAASR